MGTHHICSRTQTKQLTLYGIQVVLGLSRLCEYFIQRFFEPFPWCQPINRNILESIWYPYIGYTSLTKLFPEISTNPAGCLAVIYPELANFRIWMTKCKPIT